MAAFEHGLSFGADGLERIIHELGKIEHIRDLKLNSVTDDRKLSFAGGVAILSEVFEQLGIRPHRALADDLQLQTNVMSYGGSGVTISVPPSPNGTPVKTRTMSTTLP